MDFKLSKDKSGLTPRHIVLGVQFLFVAFGATVLVPLLVGIDPAVALFCAGLGTLIFHLVTKGKVPIFLGSSFAFIAPIIQSTKLYGLPGTISGLVAVGFVYGVVSALVKFRGIKFIERMFPAAVVGPVIMIIGLSLATTGVNMAKSNWLIAVVTLSTAIVVVVFGRGMLKLIPIFSGIIVGYLLSLVFGKIDFTAVNQAAWFSLPKFVYPQFNWGAVLYLIPVAIAPVIEHVGDIYAIGNVADKNFVKDPGLHRTMLGDGLACSVAGLLGGPPVTTYAEVTGAISLTKVTEPILLRIAAIAAIIFSLVGKINGFLKTIPEAVLGGIMLLLFGMIASIGIKTLIDSRTDLSVTRNQVIVSIVMTVGIGGAVIQWGSFSLGGIGLASVVGMVLNLILPQEKEKAKGTSVKLS
ncbi:MAG: solute carrier family 23 protein [Bacteroidota bacterium]|nr:solute carrier family 23 protein [Bacteroidota bacterium]MDP4205768.1 solute carrier family 23 protein [Bacteroidota bacterium]